VSGAGHPEYPGTGLWGNSRQHERITAAEQRGDFDTALYLMLIHGPPQVTCGNDSFSHARHRFMVTYYEVRSGREGQPGFGSRETMEAETLEDLAPKAEKKGLMGQAGRFLGRKKK
jgi:hypothetical protein